MKKEVTNKQFKDQVTDFLESNTKGAIATKVILATIALGGVVFVGAAAPGVIKAIEQMRRLSARDCEEEGVEKPLKKSTVQSTISQFKRNGYIQIKREEKSGKTSILLTEKGRQHVFNFTHKMHIKKPLVWDRKWRVVIFDIPVHKKRERDMFGHKIKEMGFKQLQKSVWAHPYKCEDELFFLAKQLRIVKCIEILTVQKLIHEQVLRKSFGI